MITQPAREPISIERLVGRVPPPPRSLRALRYRGEDRAVPLSGLSPGDREGVRALYAVLMDFDAALRARLADRDEPDAVQALAASFELDRALSVARSIGDRDAGLSEEVRRALHDVRGGALTALLCEVQRARLGRSEPRGRALRTLVSDHLKVMRNAVLELDDGRRAADLEPSEHSIERLAETLARVTGDGRRGGVHVGIQCSFVGGITMSCVELGALDRAALNLLNNAVRYSAIDRVEVSLAPATSAPGSDLRILVANSIEDAHARALRGRFREDLARIFVEPFSTTGSGDGLKICVDFVSAAYGLVRAEDAVRAGLVGAALDGEWFLAWLHWPAIA